MKKTLLSLGIITVASLLTASVAQASIYEAPNMGNLNFYPLMQQQMEKQETLDYAKDPDNYKEKREAKSIEADIRSSNFNPNYKNNYSGTLFNHQVSQPTQMQFLKGSDGSIKIQEVK